MRNQKQEFSVWPLMIDMLTSLLIIIILFNFFDEILRPENIEQKMVEIRRTQFHKQFVDIFKYELSNNKIKVSPNFDYLQITFSDKILFSSGSYSLEGSGASILKKFGRLIPQNAGNKIISYIQVEGHTDRNPINSGGVFPKDNWDLSSARAISVVRFLTNLDKEIEPSLFSSNGFGEFSPVSPNDENKNRRIEIKVFFSDKKNIRDDSGK